MSGGGLVALRAPLDAKTRRMLRGSLRALLDFQENLARWPRIHAAPDATPVVSLYADGRLLGCYANGEGRPGERLARAFLLALGDQRFGGIEPRARGRLVAQVAYPIGVRRVSLDAAPRVIAPGAHGLALSSANALPALLVPEVAREHELDAYGFLRALEEKARSARGHWPQNGLWLYETERVIARRGVPKALAAEPGVGSAVKWLAERVAASGAVAFGCDPRDERDTETGPMLHGRSAVVVQALAKHPSGRAALGRARRWLEREIRAGLGSKSPEGWPDDAAMVAGTLALAKLAGLDVAAPLLDLARRGDVAKVPWHAAQVVFALGADAPEKLWRACVRALDRDARAPWIALAAAARGDAAVFERVALALSAQVREHGPHRGGVGSGGVPELALTAITIEALASSSLDSVRRALRSARAFVRMHQIVCDEFPEASRPERLLGAFRSSPIHGFLRADVTAHAVLALGTEGRE